MKKHRQIKLPPLFKHEKDVAKLLSQKDGMAKVKEFAAIAEQMQQSANKLNETAKDLTEWHIRICNILPEEYQDNEELRLDIANLVTKYDSKSE